MVTLESVMKDSPEDWKRRLHIEFAKTEPGAAQTIHRMMAQFSPIRLPYFSLP